MLNSKTIKKIVFGLFIIFFLFTEKTFAIVEPTDDFFVNDYANVLTQETKDHIIQSNEELQEKTGAQIVVVTVQSLENKSIEEYATELFRKFGIGDKEKNNGVLLLCSTGERMFRIEVGYGLEGALPDGKTGRIQDEYIIPYLRSNNYNEGIFNGFNAVLEEVANEYTININNQIEPEPADALESTQFFGNQIEPELAQRSDSSDISIFAIIYIAIILFIFVIVIVKANKGGSNRNHWSGGGSSFHSGSSGGFSGGGGRS